MLIINIFWHILIINGFSLLKNSSENTSHKKLIRFSDYSHNQVNKIITIVVCMLQFFAMKSLANVLKDTVGTYFNSIIIIRYLL